MAREMTDRGAAEDTNASLEPSGGSPASRCHAALRSGVWTRPKNARVSRNLHMTSGVGIVRTSLLEAPSWPLLSPTQRCCAAVREALTLRTPDADDWLGRIAASVSRIETEPVGVVAGVVERVGASHATERCAIAGFRRADREAYAAQLEQGWAGDETLAASTEPSPSLAPACLRRVDVLDDAAWRGSSLAAERRLFGAHDFARAVFPHRTVAGLRHFVLQIDGLRRAWRPTPDVVDRLRGVAPVIFSAYESRFVRLPLHRRRLLDRVTPMQREIAPLLAHGLSEAQIAQRLGRSRHTVHDHTKAIYRAWGICSRHELRELWDAADA